MGDVRQYGIDAGKDSGGVIFAVVSPDRFVGNVAEIFSSVWAVCDSFRCGLDLGQFKVNSRYGSQREI